MKNVTALIQARIGSTRLPGKVMMAICGREMLLHVVSRIKQCLSVKKIAVITSINSHDERIVKLCGKHNIDCFCGSEENVLERYFQAAKVFSADPIIRITADCPLIDPKIVDCAVEMFFRGHFDYVSNTIERTYPRGLDVEVFNLNALSQANEKVTEVYQKEHVTPYIWENKEYFKIGQVKSDCDYSKYRLTVDTEEDLALVKELYAKVYASKKDNFNYGDLIAILEKEPALARINEAIRQKPLR